MSNNNNKIKIIIEKPNNMDILINEYTEALATILSDKLSPHLLNEFIYNLNSTIKKDDSV